MSQDQKLDKIILQMQNIQEDVSSIKRAIYGDKPNEVDGLLTRQASDEKRITSLENTRKRVRYWAGGFMVGIQAVWYAIYKFLHS